MCLLDTAGGKCTCPTGWACNVQCTGPMSCQCNIDCSQGVGCTINCSGYHSCQSVTCGSGPCDVTCGSKACGKVDNANASAAQIDCLGQGCSGTSSCPGNGNPACLKTGCVIPTGCSDTKSGCDSCP